MLPCGGPAAARPDLLLRRAGPDPAASPRAGIAVTVDRDALRGFRLAGGGRLVLPRAGGADLEVVLERLEVLAPGAIVTLTGARGPVPYRPDLTLFRGRVEGEPGSLAVFAMSAGRVTGRIRLDSGWLLVAPLGAEEGGAGHVVVPEADLPAPPEAAFSCLADEMTQAAAPVPAGLPPLPADIATTTTRLVCDLALDCDYDFFAKEGSDSARAVAYALVMLGTSSAIYEREINVTLRASYLNLWTTASDPYTATTLDGQLTEFKNYWVANRSGVTRDLAQLVSGRALGGGIAWIGALCSSSYGYSVISNLTGSNTYPTNVTTWDINVMAHELGHNFNSRHTHSCWWQSNGYAPSGALLDSCYTAEGTCYGGSVGITPADLGTIMSYCHLLGGEDHIRLDFHAACRTVMRYAAEHAACFAAADGAASDGPRRGHRLGRRAPHLDGERLAGRAALRRLPQPLPAGPRARLGRRDHGHLLRRPRPRRLLVQAAGGARGGLLRLLGRGARRRVFPGGAGRLRRRRLAGRLSRRRLRRGRRPRPGRALAHRARGLDPARPRRRHVRGGRGLRAALRVLPGRGRERGLRRRRHPRPRRGRLRHQRGLDPARRAAAAASATAPSPPAPSSR